ncbi:MAG TPA: cob(I)yrinic acid a,c-diamide adenosyltransferase [Spirochaetota bacterium]|nr:cob(I)yrinic acid a,c-diamide adenosyltransferase [Spirochaetota bacterium]
MKQGKIHLYTGNGKGKTTAALGLVLRACGASMKSYIAQFMKSGDFSEIKALERFGDLVHIEQNGPGEFYNMSTSDYIVHRGCAKKGYDAAKTAILSGEYDMVVLDEIIGACAYNLVTYDELLVLLEAKPESVELVLTGREAPTDLYEKCDLVTEMKEVKHYYNEGIKARKGVDY